MTDTSTTSLNGHRDPPTPPERATQTPPAPTRRDRRWWQADALFLVGVFLLALLTYYAFAGAGALGQRPANNTSKSSAHPTVGATPTLSGLVASVRPANATAFNLPNANAGAMWPAVDQSGNVWFGEMEANRLARLDPHTGKVTEWTPPNGNYGIMQVLVDGNGTIWYAEDGGNYIGRFNPITQQFTTYPLSTVNNHNVGPYAMAFDSQGKIWFTGVNGGVIGEFDPATGQTRTWTVPSPGGSSVASPACIAVAPTGKIWFGTLTGGQVGYLDPSSGQFTVYHVNEPNAVIFGMTADAQGHVWFTELQSPYLGEVDPTTGKVTTQVVPALTGTSAGLYQIVATSDRSLWFASAGANALIRYTPSSGAYVFYQLSQDQSVPYGLALDGSGHVWFTADGQPEYIGELTP